MGHGPNLIPDETIFIQLGLFFITYFVLKYLVFKPYLKLFEIRRLKTSGALEEAQNFANRANEIKANYEKKIFQERKKNVDTMLNEKGKIIEEGRVIINNAKKEAEEFLEKRIMEIKSNAEKIRIELSRSIPDFSKQIISKISQKRDIMNEDLKA